MKSKWYKNSRTKFRENILHMTLPIQILINLYTQKFYYRNFIHKQVSEELEDCFGANLIILVSLIFNTNLLAVNKFMIRDKVPMTLYLSSA
jgi:hypothetical protein